MNIKMMTFVSTLTLILPASVSAQAISILPGGRGNPHIGMPSILPGPTSNIVISPRINLPAPLLTPTVALTLAPVPMAASISPLYVALPAAALAALPLNRVVAERENVKMPFPALSARFAAPAKGDAAKDAAAARERLEELFDGLAPADKERPVRSGRQVTLPEGDLEKEIGAY